MEPYARRILKRAIIAVVLVSLGLFARHSGFFGESREGGRIVKVSNNTGATLQLSLLPLADSSRAKTWPFPPGAVVEVAYKSGDFLGLTDSSNQWMERHELIGASRLQIKPGGGRSKYVFD